MANLVIVPADVGMTTTSPSTRTGTAGVTLAEGDAVYLDSATSKYKLASAAAATTATIAGIVLTPAILDEKFTLATKGDYDCGVTIAAGQVYALSATAGKIAPIEDITTATNVTSILGYGVTGKVLRLGIVNTGLIRV